MIALEGIARDVTERRRAEQALLESEVRYRGIFDGVEEAIFVETPAGDILDMNQSACAMYGWTREEFLTKKVADLLPPEYVALRLDETGRGQLAERFVETVNRRANGEEFPVEISGRIHTLNGQSAILVVVRDITERKQAEIKEHKQLTALEAAANAIVITDQDGNIEWVNPAWSGLTGYAREEAIGKNPRILKSGRHPVEFYKSMWDTILAGKVWRGELVNQRKDGSRYDEEETITPVLDVHGEVRNFVAVKQDITGRKRAEAELQHLKEFNENIVQKMTEGIVVQDAVGQILFVNPAAAVLLGYPPEALVGQSWTHIVPADQHTIVRAADARRARGESDQYELDLVRADRTRLTVLVSAGPHRYNGHPVGVLVVFTDITARKQAEIDLLQRNRELNVLNRIGQALSRLLPLPELVELIYLTVGEVLDNRNLSLALYDESAHSLSFALYTIDGQRQTTPDRPLGHGLTEYILHTRAPLLITHDMSAALRERGITSIGHGAACYLGVPLLVGEKVLGVIALQDYEHEGAYTPHHVELLATIAAQAAIALENARLFAETHQRLEQLQALQTIDTAISGSLDLRLTLNVVLEQVMRQLGVHAAAVLLLEPQSLTLHYAAGRGFHSRAVEHTYVRLGQGLAGQAALERQTVHVPDLTDTGSYFYRAELRQAEGFVAYYAVPLVSKGRTLGVLEIFHRAPLNDDADWVNFLETLAGQTAIAVDNAQLFENLQRSNVELIAAYDNTLEGWSRALDLRDKETEGHSQRVTDLTLRLAQAIGMTADELVHVRRGALLHDIGKLGIPDAILLKPGKLTDDEWVIMRKHPTFAYELLLPITYLGPALAIPYGHHEKWDGTGYPRGLRGDAIPLAARIFAVVDVWDALRSDRPYRAAWPTEKVLEHIQAGSGTHFDPAVVQTFVRVMGQT